MDRLLVATMTGHGTEPDSSGRRRLARCRRVEPTTGDSNRIAIGSRGSALALARRRPRRATRSSARAWRPSRSSSSRPTATAARRTRPGAKAPSSPRSSGRCSTAASTSRSTARRTSRPTRTRGSRIAAYLPRADPRDALVVRADATERRLDDLPPGTRVGTDSPRRTGFLLARRPDLVVHPLHGNVDTRLRRLDAGETDALVLACAGLDRLGLGRPDRGAARTPTSCRRRRARARSPSRSGATTRGCSGWPRPIDDRRHAAAVEAERAFLEASGGGCRAPIGALATIVGDDARPPRRATPSPDGSRDRSSAPRARRARRDASASALPRTSLPTPRRGDAARRRRRDGRRVLVTRAAEQSDALRRGAAGRRPRSRRGPGDRDRVRAGRRRPRRAPRDRCTRTPGWSSRAPTAPGRSSRRPSASASRSAAPRWAAIGRVDRRVLEREGIEVDFRPSRSPGGDRWRRSCRSTPATASSSSAATSPTTSSRSPSGAAAPRSTTSSPTGRARRRRARARCSATRSRRADRRGRVHERLDRPRPGRRSRPADGDRRHLDPGRLHRPRDGRRSAARPGSGSSPSPPTPDADRPRRGDRRGPRPPAAGDRMTLDLDAPPVTPTVERGRRSPLRSAPAAAHAGAPRAGPRDPPPPVDARRAALRPAGLRRPRADRLDARRRPPVAGRGRRRGRAPGRPRRRRRHPVRPAGGEGRRSAPRRRPTTASSRRRSAGSARSTCRS